MKTISHDKILLQSQGVTVTWKVLDGLLILCLRWSRHESQPLQQLRPEPKSKWMGRAFRLLASLWAAACFYFLLPRASGLQEKKVLVALGGEAGRRGASVCFVRGAPGGTPTLLAWMKAWMQSGFPRRMSAPTPPRAQQQSKQRPLESTEGRKQYRRDVRGRGRTEENRSEGKRREQKGTEGNRRERGKTRVFQANKQL